MNNIITYKHFILVRKRCLYNTHWTTFNMTQIRDST